MIQSRERQLLYVDDTEEQRYAMTRILEGAGFKVTEASSGAEAFRRLFPTDRDSVTSTAPSQFLAVLLDVKLPDMSGYDVCRRIKSDPRTSSIPVLQISASFADPSLRAAGLSGGADAYAAQPVHPAELVSLVNALIRSHDSEKTLRFQAAASAQLTSSLDYNATVASIERVFVPAFADACFVCLRTPQPLAAEGTTEDQSSATCSVNTVPPPLLARAMEVCRSGTTTLVDPCTLVVPMDLGRQRLGALVFVLYGEKRTYSRANFALAEDLADRAALALQNAALYSAQKAAQEALVQSEKLAAAGRLSAAIAHEINNPLEAITNLIYLIDTSPEITPTIKTYAQEALSELSRLTHIARQSLGFYRELTGPSRFDLADSLEDTLSIYGKRLMTRRIHIERDYTPGIVITAVKGEVRQVISNLIVNAYDALPRDGIIWICTRLLPDDMVCFSVRDNGSGIAEGVLPRIFDPFFTTKESTGTGLGLWVSKNIVEKHGGSISVVSQTEGPERGTTFEVTLPCHLKVAATA